MKKGIYLTLFVMGAMLTSNFTILPESHGRMHRIGKWTKQKRANVQRMWFCLRNQAKCSKQEVTKAKRWFIGAPTAAIVAALATAGIAVTTYMVNQNQKSVQAEVIIKGENPAYQDMSPQEKVNAILANRRLSPKQQCDQIIPIVSQLGDGNFMTGIDELNQEVRTSIWKICPLGSFVPSKGAGPLY